jgi:DNA-binding response OmpR family regulator
MSKRVLVVDDHTPTRTLIRSILETEKAESFEVVEAANGRDCLEAMDHKGPFDVVLLDVGLPDMDGFTVCRSLRAIDARVPVVFVTARNALKDFTHGREVGADSYLVKPIARAPLRSLVMLFANMARPVPAADLPAGAIAAGVPQPVGVFKP